jgi:cytochrome c oxidase assembly protein subunit 15
MIKRFNFLKFNRFFRDYSVLAVKEKKKIGTWYLGSAGLVFGIVVLGGLTRLTESGLSITEWNLVKGIKFPSNLIEWQEEFDKYKESPEGIILNKNISIEEFKNIFFMEWAHRLWGYI